MNVQGVWIIYDAPALTNALAEAKASVLSLQYDSRLEWPTEVTETEFFEQLEKLPKSETHSFLQQ